MSHMVVNKMGPPSRMLIRWVCPNQQMATFQTRETTNGTTRYLNHINKFADQQDGPTTHIVVSGPISLFLLSRKHKMGCANCIHPPTVGIVPNFFLGGGGPSLNYEGEKRTYIDHSAFRIPILLKTLARLIFDLFWINFPSLLLNTISHLGPCDAFFCCDGQRPKNLKLSG